MPIVLHNSTTGAGLFDLLGLAFHTINTINTSVATTGTIGTTVQNLLAACSLQTGLPFQGMASTIPAAQTSSQATGTLASTIASTCQTILEAFITNDGGTPNGIQNDLIYLINDMSNHTSVGADHVSEMAAITTAAAVSAIPVGSATASYTNGDTLTILGGTFATVAKFTTTVVNGQITALTPSQAGSYSVIPPNPVAFTQGSGTGAGQTLAVTWSNGLAVGVTSTMTGDWQLAYTDLDGNGFPCQFCLSEVVTVAVTALDTNYNPTFSVTSPTAISDMLNWAYNTYGYGSGLNTALPNVGSSNLLPNGNFATCTNDPDEPDDWIITSGTPETNVIVTQPQQQTLTLSGAPTSGAFIIEWTDLAGIVRATAPISYTFLSSNIQTALNAIPGLTAVTVAQTSATVCTVTMTGVPGNSAVFTCPNSGSTLVGGTSPLVTPAISVAGDTGSYDGSTLKFTQQTGGSVKFEMFYALPALTTGTTYLLSFRLRAASVGASSGNIVVAVTKGLSPGTTTVVADLAGNSSGGNNAITIGVTTVSTTANAAYQLAIRVPATAAQPVYLHVYFDTAPAVGSSWYFDNFYLTQAQQLYTGGPAMAVFQGNTPPAIGNTWVVAFAANRGGGGNFQYWCNRVFNLANYALLLPVTGTGSVFTDPTI